ncbi:MBL fold metallo-hydrolase [candidate division WWE3 bacterium]|nr:MBL fold metallo-hydrolase [candidate division WWE3 bacterium]
MKSETFLLIAVTIFKLLLAFNNSRGQYLELAFLDVGQGDAILITTPQKKHILIDGGEGYSVGQALDAYFPLNNCKLEVMVLTHPHADHLEGLLRTLEHCRVERVIFNAVSYDSGLYDAWLAFTEGLFSSQDLVVESLVSGEAFQVDGVTFYALWPYQKDIPNGFSNLNNSSLVLLLDYGDFEALLTGDAEVEALSEIYSDFAIDKGFSGGVPALSKPQQILQKPLEVYKASHHGSKNGLYKSLWKSLDPEVTVISVGKENDFGHPSPEVLEFFESEKAVVKRTDVAGTVKIRYNLTQYE